MLLFNAGQVVKTLTEINKSNRRLSFLLFPPEVFLNTWAACRKRVVGVHHHVDARVKEGGKSTMAATNKPHKVYNNIRQHRKKWMQKMCYVEKNVLCSPFQVWPINVYRPTGKFIIILQSVQLLSAIGMSKYY